MNIYKTHGTCSKEIRFDVENKKVKNVQFIGGCLGNLRAVSKLVEGKDIDEVISLLSGIQCHNNTSCGDQLSLALLEYKEKNGL